MRKMRRSLCFVLVVLMLVTAVPATAFASSQPSRWAEEDVSLAIWSGLVPSHLQSDYTQATTRAEFAALAVALYENQRGSITGRVTFVDTDDVNVQKAAHIGVVEGIGNNRFDPHSSLTREQAAAMLTRLAVAVDSPLPSRAPTFVDNDRISWWASAYAGQVQGAGIMEGIGGNRFSPQGTYTREQSIVTILRLFTMVWGSPLGGLLDFTDWELEDILVFDGWNFEFLDMPTELASLQQATFPRGGVTQIIRHNYGWLHNTIELHWSDSDIQRIRRDLGIMGFDFVSSNIYAGLTMAAAVATAGKTSIADAVIKQLVSITIKLIEADFERMQIISGGYGAILTLRIGAHALTHYDVRIRSQFIPQPDRPTFVVQRNGTHLWAFPNDPDGATRNTLSSGTLVTVVGGRRCIYSPGVWLQLDNGSWVNGALLERARPLQIQTSVYPQGGGTLSGGGSFYRSQRTQLNAQPNAGWEFVGWYENNRRVSDRALWSFEVTQYRNLQARFRSTQPPQGAFDIQSLLGVNFNNVRHLFGPVLESEAGYWYSFAGINFTVSNNVIIGIFATYIEHPYTFTPGRLDRTQATFGSLNGNSTRGDARSAFGAPDWDGEHWTVDWMYGYRRGNRSFNFYFNSSGRLEIIAYYFNDRMKIEF